MARVNVVVNENEDADADGAGVLRPLREPNPRRLGELAADALRRAILLGQLGAGTRLVEDDLAARLHVSRGPIRDALRQLAEEGLVSTAGRGASVAATGLDNIRELYSLRCAIECLSVELAIQLFSKRDLAEARARLEAMLRAAAEGPLESFVDRDLAFHTLFYERVGHRRLLRAWQALEPSFRVLLSVANINPRIDEVLRMHERILAAVEAGDAAEAQRWVRAHLAEAERVLSLAYRADRRHSPP